MKKILFTFFTMILTVAAVFAQVPQKFSYQAVVRNANNQLMANASVGVRVSVVQGSIFGPSVFVETHNVTTNANGLLTLEVGDGTALQGSMSDINWGNGPYFLKTEMDPNGGTNYSITSTQQLLSVPYALYAAEAGNVPDFSVTTDIVEGVGTYVTITDASGPHTFLVPASSSGGTFVQQQADWAETDTTVVSYIRNKPNLASVATSGDYHDLMNTPTTPNLDSLLNAFNQSLASLTQRVDSIQGGVPITPDTTAPVNFHCESSTLTDVDGNIYNTVLIGNQCWMRENLRCTHYADGSPIQLGGITSNTVAYRYYPNHSSSNVTTYGYLYNWSALTHEIPVSSTNTVGIRGVCPAGWRIPTETEWTQLVSYMGGQSEYILSGNSSYIAKALCSTSYWNTNGYNNSPGNNLSSNNASGFSAVPAGRYNGNYEDFGNYAYFWTATENSSLSAKCFVIYSSSASTSFSYYEKSSGMSVRCVLGDTMTLTIPSVTTDAASNIRISAATSGGNVNATGGAGVTAKGVCWSTSPNPTIDDFLTADGSETGTFSSELAGLTQGTTYYLRAYATNIVGTAYGEEVSFTTLSVPTGDAQPCPNNTTVTDVDGNVYNTVQIGDQCWMRENLRTTHYADSSIVPLGATSSTSETSPYRYNPNNSASNVPTYGYLYNWAAVMHDESPSSENPSGVQGVCPSGWHVPSEAEWGQLVDYLTAHEQYYCGNNSNYIAKALASTNGWDNSTGTYVPGNNPEVNNATGFSAMPAGYYDNNFYSFGSYAYFWSTSEYIYTHYSSVYYYAKYVQMNYSNPYWPGSNYIGKGQAFSVRCLLGAGTPVTAPIVTTDAPSNILLWTATAGGNVASTGGGNVTAKGVCWSTSQNPTLADSHTVDGEGAGTFTSALAGLTAGTVYYMRAYATNFVGTAYGEEVAFTTLSVPVGDAQPCSNNATVTDYNSNVYNTVQIGEQCWMRENLRSTHYADGTPIPLGSTTTTSETTPCRYNPNNNAANVAVYGYLYNWAAVMHDETPSSANPSGVQGVCPSGWHVPSEAEWGQLEDYLTAHEQYYCGNNSNYIAKALASTNGWDNSTGTYVPGNNPEVNNATGFSAMPAGYYDNNFYSFGSYAYFWSTSEYIYTHYSSVYYYAKYVQMNYSNPYWPGSNYTGKGQAFSVRCLLGAGTPVTAPIVTTDAPSDIRLWTATAGGNVASTGGGNVTVKGICWSTSHNPTLEDSYTVDGEGTGTFTSELIGLTAGTTYYVRAYATNFVGTAYGEEVEFTTLSVPAGDAQPCPGAPTVTDYDDNVYNTVKIGSQCWMRENLHCTHYADGTSIPLGSTTSTTTAYRYNPNNNSSIVATHGYLYNWPAVMKGESSSNTNPSGVQGICPTGWHVPSDAEWGQLTNYLSSFTQYTYGNSTSYIAKSLASTEGWNGYSASYTIGNNLSLNNASGFSALPVGSYSGSYNYFGSYAYYWSANENNSSNAYYMSLGYDGSGVARSTYNKYNGFSVRCLRN